MTTYVLDTNVLIFVQRSSSDAAVAGAVRQLHAATGDTTCTIDAVIRELKARSDLWPSWRASSMKSAVPERSIPMGSLEDVHLQAMRAQQATQTHDQGERTCIAWCTTAPGAVFVTHDAGAMRLAITEFARVLPVGARVATLHEWLAVLRTHGGLPLNVADAVLAARGQSARLPAPTWWP